MTDPTLPLPPSGPSGQVPPSEPSGQVPPTTPWPASAAPQSVPPAGGYPPPAVGYPPQSAPPATGYPPPTAYPASPGPAYPPPASYAPPGPAYADPYTPVSAAPHSAPPGQYPPAVPGQAMVPSPRPPEFHGAPTNVVAAQIGEIMVMPPVIRTPAGDMPLAGAEWEVADYWVSEQKVPQWAIICAIVGFFCLTIFSLLFLLAKETVHRGTVQVTVRHGARQYVARIPVVNQAQVMHINNQVNYARSLASHA